MTTHWAYCNSDGIVQSYTSQPDNAEPSPMAGLILVRLQSEVYGWHNKKIDLNTKAVVSYKPPSPGDSATQSWTWDIDAERWISAPTIDAVKSLAWSRIKAERERRLLLGFTVSGHHYQVNQAAMAGATLAAFMVLMQGGEPASSYRQAWVLADNSTVSLTAPEMIAVGVACKKRVDALFDTSQTLRGLIYAIESSTGTSAEVEAITWPLD